MPGARDHALRNLGGMGQTSWPQWCSPGLDHEPKGRESDRQKAEWSRQAQDQSQGGCATAQAVR
jgi:hypothetical protein